MVTWRPFYLLRFVELRLDELLDRVERVALVRTVGFHEDRRAAAGGEQQNAEDRLPVDLLVAFPDLDVRLEARRGMHELRGSACVEAQLVLDLEGTFGQRPAPLAVAASRSDATRIAFDPFSVIVCASMVTSFASCCSIANFTIIGRFTQVTISTRPCSRNERLMFDGVPPNMSVKMMTGRSAPMFSRAARIFSRAWSTVSVHSSGTASMPLRFASIFWAALSSSYARFPCVTIRPPTTIDPSLRTAARHDTRKIHSSPAVPVDDLDRVPPLQQVVAEALGDGDAAVLAAGAADADREVALHLAAVLRREIGHEVEEAGVEVVVFRLFLEVRDHLGVEAGLRPQLLDEVRVRQEADVEQQVEVVRRLVLEPERDHGDQHARLVAGQLEPLHHLGFELVHRELRGVEHHVRERLHLAQLGALALDRLQHRQILRHRVRTARLAVAARDHLVA